MVKKNNCYLNFERITHYFIQKIYFKGIAYNIFNICTLMITFFESDSIVPPLGDFWYEKWFNKAIL